MNIIEEGEGEQSIGQPMNIWDGGEGGVQIWYNNVALCVCMD